MPQTESSLPTEHTAHRWRMPAGSLYHWALIGFLLVTLPLVMALVSGLLAVSEYTEKSQRALFLTVRANEGGRTLLERLISMERSIRQYQILKDRELLNVYLQNHRAFDSVAQGLRLEGLSDELRSPLEALVAAEATLFDFIEERINDPAAELLEADLEGYVALTLQARKLQQIGDRQVGLEAGNLAREASRVRQSMLFWALLALPLALVLGLLFVYLMTRPMKRIQRVIRELGAGRFDLPVVIHGPSDLADIGRRLDWMRKRLRDLESEKQRFIRNLSHELKTPLATLREGADLLEEQVVGELNYEQREIVQLMKIGAFQLNGMVENLLEFQRLASRQQRFQTSEVDLTALLNKVIEEHRLLVRSKQLKIEAELPPVSLQGDRESIRMMLSNLLGNAIKFSPVGGRIRLDLSQSETHVEFTVRDQGEGIAEQDKAFVFEEFYQGERGQSGIRGSGLGLALVMDTVKRHQGSVVLLLEDETYCGAGIRIELPRFPKGQNA